MVFLIVSDILLLIVWFLLSTMILLCRAACDIAANTQQTIVPSGKASRIHCRGCADQTLRPADSSKPTTLYER